MTLKVPIRNGGVVVAGNAVRLITESDSRGCRCCATECEAEITVTVSWCGMTAVRTFEIPGVLGGWDQVEMLPDESYLIVSAQIACTPCGWELLIGVCAYCVATGQAASDAFTASIPFADAEEPGGGYCPRAGAVDLKCFGLQFGIPCVVTASASIA